MCGGATTALHRHFVDLAGRDTANVVCVPTAHPYGKLSGWCRRLFRRADVPRARRTVLHTRDAETADTEAFVAADEPMILQSYVDAPKEYGINVMRVGGRVKIYGLTEMTLRAV